MKKPQKSRAAKVIEKALTDQRRTKYWLVGASGLDQTTVYGFLSGRYDCRTSTLMKMMKPLRLGIGMMAPRQ